MFLNTKINSYWEVSNDKRNILTGDYRNCFDIIMKSSSYKMDKKSKFYLNDIEGKNLINSVFDDCFFHYSKYMESKNLVLSEFIIGRLEKVEWSFFMFTPWNKIINLLGLSLPDKPFEFLDNHFDYNEKESVFYVDGMQGSGKISGGQNDPTTNYLFHNAEFIAYLVKCIEQGCREKLNYRPFLHPSYTYIYGTNRLNDLADSGEMMDIVRDVINDYYKER